MVSIESRTLSKRINEKKRKIEMRSDLDVSDQSRVGSLAEQCRYDVNIYAFVMRIPRKRPNEINIYYYLAWQVNDNELEASMRMVRKSYAIKEEKVSFIRSRGKIFGDRNASRDRLSPLSDKLSRSVAIYGHITRPSVACQSRGNEQEHKLKSIKISRRLPFLQEFFVR